MGSYRDDVVHGQVAQHAGFYLHGLHIHLPFHLVAGFQLLAVHHLGALKHTDAGVVEVVLEDDGARLLDIQPTFGSLAHPRLGVAVAVETYGLAGLDVVLQHIEDGAYLVIAGSNLGIHTLPETGEGFGHSGVECYHG